MVEVTYGGWTDHTTVACPGRNTETGAERTRRCKAGRHPVQGSRHVETASGYASIGTMLVAKGLEFRAVAVMARDDEVIPMEERIETVGDDADLQELYDTEPQLLYVACTRGRDHLLVIGVAQDSAAG
jgi:superfamily I DNA/RNA helicase